jgi:ribonuclease HIII
MSSCFVIQIDLSLSQKLEEALYEQGFIFSKPVHTLFQAKKKHLTVTLYTSGKLMVQGKESKEFVQSYLEPEILKTFTVGYEHLYYDQTPRIGVDESGKGDFFGPLCIAGVFAEGEHIQKLAEIGVKDSKKLQDSSIKKIGEKIRNNFLHHIVKIGPEKYNELYEKFGNLNLLLGWGHATVIDYLLQKQPCKKVIIDQFAAEHIVLNALKKKKVTVSLFQRTQAEEDLVVAAASILARETFINGLSQLEKQLGIALPKGASKAVVAAGKKLVDRFGADILNSTSKLHFKTRLEILL